LTIEQNDKVNHQEHQGHQEHQEEHKIARIDIPRTNEQTEEADSLILSVSCRAFLSVSLGTLGVLGALGDFRCCFRAIRG
jgi:hypothetical protein